MNTNILKSLSRRHHMMTAIIMLLMFVVSINVQSQTCIPKGNWLGYIDAGGSSIRLGLHLEDNSAVYSGFLTSPDQTKDSFDLDKISWVGDSLILNCKKLRLKFFMRMNQTCDTLIGEWSSGKKEAIKMFSVNVLPVMERPQEPIPPYPYTTQEVKFPNKKAGIELAGTLSIPTGDGPFPAVIMITGSGPQDRNETLLGHKPFLVIADYLTRSGIAVLRYDDRGVGSSGGDFKTATSYDFATDAQAAFDFLITQPHINPAKIGLAGHSEGGMIAPIVAAKNSKVAFIILLAGPGTTGKQILLSQAALIAAAENTPEEDIKKTIAINSKIYDLIESQKDPKKLATDLRAFLKKEADSLSQQEKEDANLTDAAINNIVISVSSPWFIEFVAFDPQPWLKKVSCPVLALNGEKDLQVPCNENLDAIKAALASGKCKDYTIKALPGLNHLFQHCNTCRIGEYASLSETFSPEVMQIMTDWIKNLSK